MGFLDSIEWLITEHGSAAILKERIGYGQKTEGQQAAEAKGSAAAKTAEPNRASTRAFAGCCGARRNMVVPNVVASFQVVEDGVGPTRPGGQCCRDLPLLLGTS